MAGMIKSSIHHFDGFVGLAGRRRLGQRRQGRGHLRRLARQRRDRHGRDHLRCYVDGLSGRRDWRCRGRAVAGFRAGHDWRRRLLGPLQQVLGAARPALIPAVPPIDDAIGPPLAIVAGRRLAFGGACARADQQQRNCNGRTGLGHARITCRWSATAAVDALAVLGDHALQAHQAGVAE